MTDFGHGVSTLPVRTFPGMRPSSRLARPAAILGAVVALVATFLTVTPTIATTAAEPARSTVLIGVRNAGPGDGYTLDAFDAWQGKTSAVVQLYVRSTWTPSYVVAQLDAIWSRGSVPLVSYDLQVSNRSVIGGEIDGRVDALASGLRQWLSGPDGTYGTADDRRAYFRPAWEMNGNWYRWSPCYYAGGGGTAAEYRAMWRHLHARFAATGVTNTRLAWIFSVNALDKVSACAPETMYPGDAYVDWTGIDGYTYTSSKSPREVFEPMANRLRRLAPGKPLSINEWGADHGTAVGKPAWIDNYFATVHALDVRMSVVFNIDKERDWAVFGGGRGDEEFTHGGATFRGYRSYRTNVADDRIAGSQRSNPRLITDSQFLGLS